LCRATVHRDQGAPPICSLPGVADELFVGSIIVPCRAALEQMPVPFTQFHPLQARKNARIEILSSRMRRLNLAATQMQRCLYAPAVELTLVKEAQAGQK